jgi:hypothetical protein
MGSGRIVRWFLETSLAIANWIKIEGRFGRQRPLTILRQWIRIRKRFIWPAMLPLRGDL